LRWCFTIRRAQKIDTNPRAVVERSGRIPPLERSRFPEE